MGLDQWIIGRKFFWPNFGDRAGADERKEDGKRVKTLDVELGYWRKHPDLHGYLVETFMDGRDECQEVELSANDLRRVIAAVQARELPKTSGFFFGESYASMEGATKEQVAEEFDEDIRILQGALDWLEASDVAPVDLAKPVPIGGGLAMHEIKEDKTQAAVEAMAGAKPMQRASRSVHYRASW